MEGVTTSSHHSDVQCTQADLDAIWRPFRTPNASARYTVRRHSLSNACTIPVQGHNFPERPMTLRAARKHFLASESGSSTKAYQSESSVDPAVVVGKIREPGEGPAQAFIQTDSSGIQPSLLFDPE